MPRSGRDPHEHQSLLFGDSPRDRALELVPPAAELGRFSALAARMPAGLRLGTSSWAFPGWRGHLYGDRAASAALARHGLAAYATHPLLRTVGLDRAYYSLLSLADASALAALVPEGFRFLVKAHQSVTRSHMDAAGSTFGNTASVEQDGRPNPRFLDPDYAIAQIIRPLVGGLGRTLGPLVFQFPPRACGPGSADSADAWIDRLDRFLAALPGGPAGPQYAVEVRNRELASGPLGERLVAVLRAHSVAWGFAVHPAMPPLEAQQALTDRGGWPIERQPCLSLRWLLGHGLGYDEAKSRYEPFDRLVAPDMSTRLAIVQLARRALGAALPGWIIINNKAEGSAFRSVERLAEAVASPERASEARGLSD